MNKNAKLMNYYTNGCNNNIKNQSLDTDGRGKDIFEYFDSLPNDTFTQRNFGNHTNAPLETQGFFLFYKSTTDYGHIVYIPINQNVEYTISKNQGKWGEWEQVVMYNNFEYGVVTCEYSSKYYLSASVQCKPGVKLGLITPKAPIAKSDIQYTADFSSDSQYIIRVFSQSGIFTPDDTIDVFYLVLH